MGCRMRMAKVYQRTYPENGSGFDYDLKVRYYDKVYFTSWASEEVEEWLVAHFSDDALFIPDDHTIAPWEVSKAAVSRVKVNPKLYRAAVRDAKRLELVEDESEVKEFLEDAMASDCTKDIVRLEWW